MLQDPAKQLTLDLGIDLNQRNFISLVDRKNHFLEVLKIMKD